ncbi:MAG TPA: hypothetical protein VMX14_13315 [Anaerolineae bacterium]|nr:hypothetical protein [Anaerolineae bacterium]
MGRGRPIAPGEVFYLGRLRWRPEDGPALLTFLQELTDADPWQRERMIKNALAGGLTSQTTAGPQAGEDDETTNLIEKLLEGEW